MKKLTASILLAIFAFLSVSSQSPCLKEEIIFYFQEQIDSFQTNYPNCTEIEGDVIINGLDITNLNGLSALTSIGGNLEIGKKLIQSSEERTKNMLEKVYQFRK